METISVKLTSTKKMKLDIKIMVLILINQMSQYKDRGNKQHLSITRNFDWYRYWMLKEMVTIRFPISKKKFIS